MKKKELKAKIRAAYVEETPALLHRIKITCAGTVQTDMPAVSPRKRPMLLWRAAACAVCVVLFFSGLAVGRLGMNGNAVSAAETETIVYMDVNPSIELQLDSSGRVVRCDAGNEDAEAILSDLSLAGVERNTALTAILGAMYVGGYLSDESNSILISVDSARDTENAGAETLLREITDEIHAVFAHSEMDCSIIAQQVEVSEELRARAEEYGISVGKMHLVEKMIGGSDTLDESDLAGLSSMTVGELNLMYATRPDGEGSELFAGDIVSGLVGGFLGEEDALSSLLDAIDLTDELLERYEVMTEYEEIDGEVHPVYAVSLVLRGDFASYRFRVDCKTGELLESDFDLNFTLPDFNIGG